MKRRRFGALLFGVALLWLPDMACVQQLPPPRPEDMSRSWHLFEAEREDAEAEKTWDADRADAYLERAEGHRDAAWQLERAEEVACEGLEPPIRASCPRLGPILGLRELKAGVRLLLPAGAPARALVVRMRCHLAHARALGFPRQLGCPLYVRGTQILEAPEPAAIDVLNDDPVGIDAIREQARELVPFGLSELGARS
jgi:hypothetical protein